MTMHARISEGIPMKKNARGPMREHAIGIARPANVMIPEYRTRLLCDVKKDLCLGIDVPESGVCMARIALTRKLPNAATRKNRDGTPNATPKTAPQSFWPGELGCSHLTVKIIAAKNKADSPASMNPLLAALLAVPLLRSHPGGLRLNR